MRILLCDDEPMVRLGLKSKLMELAPGAHSFLEAVNGQELIARAAEKPDLAFVDIKMPRMDGLTAIEKAQQVSPSTIWLLLTGYSEFAYAQAALRLGVIDYLVKPIGTDELAAAMKTVAAKRQADAAARNQDFQMEMLELFYQPQSLPEKQRHPNHLLRRYTICIFFGASGERLSAKAENGLAESSDRHALFQLPSGEWCLVMESSRTPPEAGWDFPIDPQTGTAMVWQDGLCSHRALLSASERILSLAGLRIVCPLSGPIPVAELAKWECRDQLLKMASLIDRLCLAYLDQNAVAYRNALSDWCAMPRSLRERVDTAAVAMYLQSVTSAAVDAADADDLVRQLEQLDQRMGSQESRPGANGLIEQIIRYVDEHYMQDISVNSIADSMGITPSYLSRIFHKQTGGKFIDYITSVRITAAKRILSRHPHLPVKEVSERVGYANPKHFAKVFYRLTGVSPSAYQKGKTAPGASAE